MRLEPHPPSLADFIALRAAEGWGEISQDTARASLKGGLVTVCAYERDTLAGFGRVVGDGVLYFYIQDLIVAPPFRGKGYGRAMLDHLLANIKKQAAPGATIGLMAAHGKEAFYESFGFVARPTEACGAGMTQVIA